jgi:uncharacterized protein
MVKFGPTTGEGRLEILDVLRGFALFGILLVNMPLFNSPALYIDSTSLWTSTIDKVSAAFIYFFATGKFFKLFSLLFGVGLAIQMSRAESRGDSFVPYYLRRILFLLIIGLIHAYLIWFGGVLVLYALLGLLLLLFRKLPLKTILTYAIVGIIIFVALSAGRIVINYINQSNPTSMQMMQRGTYDRDAKNDFNADVSTRIYSTGTWDKIFIQRAIDRHVEYIYWFRRGFGLQVFIMFLIGLCLGRSRFFENISSNMRYIKIAWRIGLIIGILGFINFMIQEMTLSGIPFIYKLFNSILYPIASISICFFYAASIVILFQKKYWHKLLQLFVPAGRMALSNYIFQSLVCTTLFYSYGFGLYGRVSTTTGILLSIIIFYSQLVFSAYWMKRFHFGPLEWLMRSFVYEKFQPMRIETQKLILT